MCYCCVTQTAVLRVQVFKLLSLRTESVVIYWYHERLGQASFSKIEGVTRTKDISGLSLGETKVWATLKLLIAPFIFWILCLIFHQRDSELGRLEGGQGNRKE